MKWWTCVLQETDVRNPREPGTGLFIVAKVRPGWYWCFCRVRLFLALLWRKVEPDFPDRISWHLAWLVSKSAVGLTRKDLKEKK